MIIDGKGLADTILKQAKKDIQSGITQGKKPPKLVVFTIQPTPETQVFIRNKRKRMEEIGGQCKIIIHNSDMPFEKLVGELAEASYDPETSGVIVQLPLPAGLGTTTVLNYIPDNKEVEGIKKKSPHASPVGLAVLTMIKSVFTPVKLSDPETVVVYADKDADYFRTTLRRKSIVVIGNGPTGGQAVGSLLSKVKLGYINIDTNTPHPEEYLQKADIIISCVGKTIVKPEYIKLGSVLISVGIHLEDGKWAGDYHENQIADRALAYSPTPGGVGPLNIAYLLHNTVQAWKMHV